MLYGEKNDDGEMAKQWDSAGTDVEVGHVSDANVEPKEALTKGNSLLSKIQAIAGKCGIEQRGIERVPISEKRDSSLSQIGTLVRLNIPPLSHCFSHNLQ